MISGDPYVFAIWFDSVDSWSTDRFKNGCLSYFLNGNIVVSTNSTIGTDVAMMEVMSCMKSDVEDIRLFELDPSKAYEELYERAFPGMDSTAEHSDYRHFVSPPSLMDEGHIIFLIESGESAKLIYGTRGDPSGVTEVVMRRGSFQSIVRDVVKKWKGPDS